jgi:ABC-type antimicrobial peptide transport system permease subunit
MRILLFFIFCVAALLLVDMWFLKSRYRNQMWQDAQYQVQKTTYEIRKWIKF